MFARIEKKGHFDEGIAAAVMSQILAAIAYCHEKGYAHRDLKPENLLVVSKEDSDLLIKIIDFGAATQIVPGVKMKDKIGTAYYIAPEVIKQEYDEKCDVWSCGIIMYILLCGEPPFKGANEAEIMKKVQMGMVFFKRIRI